MIRRKQSLIEKFFCDAQSDFIESGNNETDPDSDEEEFWDAQSCSKGYDDSTYNSNIDEESRINILRDNTIKDEEKDENLGRNQGHHENLAA